MNLRDFQYLVALAKTHNFHQAAAECHVSQPTLSTQIKKMEDSLGVILIERNTRQVMFTDLGEQVVAKAKLILKEVSDIKEIAKAHGDPLQGQLKLGVIPTIGPYLLPEVIPATAKQLPGLQLILVENTTAQLVTALLTGDLDAALLATDESQEGLVTKALFKEPFHVLLPSTHQLSKKTALAESDLREEPILLLEDGFCMQQQVSEVCQRAKITGNQPVFKATSLETLRYMVAMGNGITLMPELALSGNFRLTKKSGLVAKPFKSPAPFRVIHLAWRKTSLKTPAIEALANLIRVL